MLMLEKLCVVLLIVFGVREAFAQQKAPDLSVKDINGKTIKLADLRGKVVLLNFWATWCVPCRTEIPDLIKKQREYRSRGLRIVGVTYPPVKITEVRRFARELKINYSIAIGLKETRQAFTSSETLPLTIIIDREGTIRGIIEGIMYSDEFEEKVMPLLSAPIGSSRANNAKPRGTSKDAELPGCCSEAEERNRSLSIAADRAAFQNRQPTRPSHRSALERRQSRQVRRVGSASMDPLDAHLQFLRVLNTPGAG